MIDGESFMEKIFISYRRKDSEDSVDHIAEWLRQRFPQGVTYYDIESSPIGEDFSIHIEKVIEGASVVLAVIGNTWLTTYDDAGRRRIDNPDDMVHKEIATALSQQKPIIPVFVKHAHMPPEEHFSPELRPLYFRTGTSIRLGRDFQGDMEVLANAILRYDPTLQYIPIVVSSYALDYGSMRRFYLQQVKQKYQDISLPIAPNLRFRLDEFYQPLKLLRDPLAVESLSPKDRRTLLGEKLDSSSHDSSFITKERLLSVREREQVVTADNGADALQLSSNRRIVVLGGPGTGKTTLLYRFMYEASARAEHDHQAPLPIFISLPDIARTGQMNRLEEYLATSLDEQGVDIRFATYLQSAVKEGKAFLCLDGLDEVASQKRASIISWINELAIRPELSAACIIGSRFTEYKGQEFTKSQFTEWELKPLTRQLRLQLSQRLLPLIHKAVYGENSIAICSSISFVETIERHQQAAAWGENPLLFNLAAYVFVIRDGQLPRSRAELYREIVDATLRSRERDDDRREETKRAIAQLALKLYQFQGRTFSRRKIQEELPKVRARLNENWEPTEMIKRILNSGMLDTVAADTYGFRHQTFQEYLVAVALGYWLTDPDKTRTEEILTLMKNKSPRSRWNEPLQLLVGVLTQERGEDGFPIAMEWLSWLGEKNISTEGDPGYLALLLALRSLNEMPYLLKLEGSAQADQLRKQIVQCWVKALIERARADRDIKYLLNVIDDITKLPAQSSSDAIQLLLVLLTDSSSSVRNAVVQALGQLGERTPVEELVQILHDADSSLRCNAASILGRLGERAPIDELIQALLDADSSVRRAVVQALGWLGERAPVDVLVQALYDTDSSVRYGAAQALGQLGERAPVDELVQALHDISSSVRYGAAEALGRLGERAPVDELVQVLHDTDSSVRSAAAQALGQLGERAPVDELVQALHDINSSVRRAAAEALRMLKDEDVRQYISQVFQSTTHSIRVQIGKWFDVLDLSKSLLLSDSPFQTSSDIIFKGIAHQNIANLIRSIPRASKALFDILEIYLYLSDWAICMSAIKALGAIRKSIPDKLILKLYELRNASEFAIIRYEADNALMEILMVDSAEEG
jgi:HEAT repeat protein/GTPase SAR1 family protein